MNAYFERNHENIAGIVITSYNVYCEDERFPKKSLFRKRLFATFYSRDAAEEYVKILNQKRD